MQGSTGFQMVREHYEELPRKAARRCLIRELLTACQGDVRLRGHVRVALQALRIGFCRSLPNRLASHGRKEERWTTCQHPA